MLEAAGFADIQEQIIRAPFNSWPADPRQKELGRWYCMGLMDWLEGLSLGPLTRVYGWPAVDVRRMTDDVKQAIRKKKTCHGYNNM